MDRNFFLAFALSTFAIFIFYTVFPPKKAPEVKKEETQVTQTVQDQAKPLAAAEAPAPVALPAAPAGQAAAKIVKIEGPLYRAELDTNQGVLKNFYLKRYLYAGPTHTNVKDWIMSIFTGKSAKPKDYPKDRLVNMLGEVGPDNQPLALGLGKEAQTLVYHASAEEVKLGEQPAQLTLTAQLESGLQLVKTLTFQPGNYLVDLEVKLINTSGQAVELAPWINFGAGNEFIETQSMRQPRVGISFDDNLDKWDEDDFKEPMTLADLQWAGVMDTYFVMAVKNQDKSPFKAVFTELEAGPEDIRFRVPRIGFQEAAFTLENNRLYEKKFTLFLGPKVEAELNKFDPSLISTQDLGWFGFIAQPLLQVLRWLYTKTLNWGVAIIMLTILVRIAMFPLAYKGMKSMKRMGQLNPKMKKLKEKYGKDKEKLNQEIMAFYKRNNVNPMGGCLPLMMQIPIFIALYSALLPAIELRHMGFVLWMDDLSAADYTLVLPLLMGVSMYVQQHLTPTPAMDATQAKVMKWMPVFMVFFFLDMPSGLVLYWVVSNIISVLQQVIFNRVKIAELVD